MKGILVSIQIFQLLNDSTIKMRHINGFQSIGNMVSKGYSVSVNED